MRPMPPILHCSQWQALQGMCEALLQTQGVIWAGVCDTSPDSRWIAFAGPDAAAPLPPEADQTFRQTITRSSAGTAILYLWPQRPRRTYVMGVLFPPAISVALVVG